MAENLGKLNEKFKKGIILTIELILCILNGVFLYLIPDSSLWWLGSYANIFGLISLVIGGIPVMIESIREVFHKNLTADILFSIALIATLYLEDFFAISLLIIMMGAGEFIEEWTVNRAHGNLESLIELQPQICHKKIIGTENSSAINDVSVGEIVSDDIIIVKQGERIAVDGIVISGNADVDQSALNGESIPAFMKYNNKVLSGSLIVDGYLEIKCLFPAHESSIEKVIRLVKSAQEEKSEFQTLTDKWAQFFAPIIICVALIAWLITQNLYLSVTILVVACPCALVLSVPTAFIASIANAARNGVWVKSGGSIEIIGKIDTVMLDKTGTLTTGNLIVAEIVPINSLFSEDFILKTATDLEYYSSHPIAKCLMYNSKVKKLKIDPPSDYKILSGIGVTGALLGKKYYFGNKTLLEFEGLNITQSTDQIKITQKLIKISEESGNLPLILAKSDEIIGIISLKDELRDSVSEFIIGLEKLGINRIGILSGDNKSRSDAVAENLGITFVKAHLKPEEKYEIIQNEIDNNHKVAMIGDGINDAPSLALSTIGIAIGQGGTALAASQADMILMDDNISNLIHIFDIGRRTIRKSKINIILALILNIIGIFLSIYGILNPIGAALWHVMESLIVVVNSTILLWIKPKKLII
ncbi:MAG TPA: cation-translocating P-type ATPase [bacterium]|nr:cation-translocating P-type ATPase [bacterium]